MLFQPIAPKVMLRHALARDGGDLGSGSSAYEWIIKNLGRSNSQASSELPLRVLVLDKTTGQAKAAINALSSATGFPSRALNLGSFTVHEVVLQPGAKRPLHVYWIDADSRAPSIAESAAVFAQHCDIVFDLMPTDDAEYAVHAVEAWSQFGALKPWHCRALYLCTERSSSILVEALGMVSFDDQMQVQPLTVGNYHSPALWNHILRLIPKPTTTNPAPASAATTPAAASARAAAAAPTDSGVSRADAAAAPTPLSASPSPTEEKTPMATLNETLQSLMQIDGAVGVCIVDSNSGMLLGKAGGGINLDMAAAGNTEVVRAKLKTMKSLGIQGSIEDILITLDTQYHIIRLVPHKPGLFIYAALDKSKANLALARYKIMEIEKGVTI